MTRHQPILLARLLLGIALATALCVGMAQPAGATPALGTISGAVYEPNGELASSARLIRVYRVEPGGTQTEIAGGVMQDRGRFSYDLEPGVYRVCSDTEQVSDVVCWGATADDPWTGADIELSAGEHVDIRLTFPPFEPLASTSQPYIAGTPKVGWTLTAKPGTWNVRDIEFAYQWLADGVRIPGATEKTFTPTGELVGQRLSVEVTGSSRNRNSATAMSGQTAPVALGTLTGNPRVSGSAKVGWTLTAQPGTWSAPDPHFSFQWKVDGVPVPGATDTTFRPGPSHVGKIVSVTVTAKAVGYSTASRTASASQRVALGTNVPSPKPYIAGTARQGWTLTANPGQWSAPDTTVSYQWLAAGSPIGGATHKTFTVTSAQAGKSISVRITARAPGYATAVYTTAAKPPVS